VKAIMRHKINRPLIERGWDDLLRLAATVKTGWAPASLMLSKLQSAPKRSPLISSLREYGRLAKTVFILRYLGSPEYRRRIQRQLNKGEALHALRQYLFCANEGRIRKHSIEDQLNQATCLTIVTNAVVIWNTVYIQAAIEQIRREGFLIDDDILQYLSPVRFEHINVFGDYSFPVKEEMRRRILRPLRQPLLTDGKGKGKL
jgi:TnpA family transposase